MRHWTGGWFLGGLLAGCHGPAPAQRLPHPLDLGADAHVHLFNGRDVPAPGFLRKLAFSGGSPLPAGTPLAGLLARSGPWPGRPSGGDRQAARTGAGPWPGGVRTPDALWLRLDDDRA